MVQHQTIGLAKEHGHFYFAPNNMSNNGEMERTVIVFSINEFICSEMGEVTKLDNNFGFVHFVNRHQMSPTHLIKMSSVCTMKAI